MNREELLQVLKEIAEGKEGQMIPYNIITRAIQPIVKAGCTDAVIYLLEHIEESK